MLLTGTSVTLFLICNYYAIQSVFCILKFDEDVQNRKTKSDLVKPIWKIMCD